MAAPTAPGRVRREPPPFRPLSVQRVVRLSPRMVRVTFGGPGLDGFQVTQPAASVRLLLPPLGADELVIPSWDRNHFVLPDGGRPTIRTFTPRRLDPAVPELDVDIVVHGAGPASHWADTAQPGMVAAVSGPARGYVIDPDATAFHLFGDETAIPAIGQLLDALPHHVSVHVVVEVADERARIDLPEHPAASVDWRVPAGDAAPGDPLVAAVQTPDLTPTSRVWAAGEAASMQRIRRHLFDELALARATTWVRGYWKHGRAGDDTDDS